MRRSATANREATQETLADRGAHARHWRLYAGRAYYIARERARRPTGRRDPFWTGVAVELARLEGRVIGERTSDRYLREAAEGPPPPSRLQLKSEARPRAAEVPDGAIILPFVPRRSSAKTKAAADGG